MNDNCNPFKAYDIRGRLGTEINDTVAYKIGLAYAKVLLPQVVVLGGDSRLSSESLKLSLANGFLDSGVDVIDIGLSGTEEIYFATSFLNIDGGIEVTASHNPADYNGMKLVSRGSVPVSRNSGLAEIEKLVMDGNLLPPDNISRGRYSPKDLLNDYVSHVLSFVNLRKFTRLRLVINSGNGAAGHVIDAIESVFNNNSIPVEIIKLNNDPDGHFPKGIPNPLLQNCREETSNAVLEHQADMGIAFDGDFDRCFIFDEKGRFIEGYYVIGMLAEAFLEKKSNSKIIHDPRLVWNTVEVVERLGGIPVQSKTGHAFIKEIMRKEDAVYGGEMSAHHYFRDFFYCDSGIIPWLLIAEMLSIKAVKLSSFVEDYIEHYPSSGEINCTLSNPEMSIANVKDIYSKLAIKIDLTDGLSMEFDDWRFNLRSSNTEPLVRLNVESRGDIELMKIKTTELMHILQD